MGFEEIRKDWRNGAITYQILVDSFAPAQDTVLFHEQIQYPEKVIPWGTPRKNGKYLDHYKVWEQEIQFYGGNLKGVIGKIPYLTDMGVDAVYLNPIFKASTYHKYDTFDYFEVDPMYGSKEDLSSMVKSMHEHGIRIILDGVFNHVGSQNPLFVDAVSDPDSPSRNYFYFEEDTNDYRAWHNNNNLPILNWTNPYTPNLIYAKPDSVVPYYISEIGIDGWRLDVVEELGHSIAGDITAAAHGVRGNTLVVGEVLSKPNGWNHYMDGLTNVYGGAITKEMVLGQKSVSEVRGMWEEMIERCGLEFILKSWLIYDNHDTPRFASQVQQDWQKRMLIALQFTLPGSPLIYYGTEVGMTGNQDPVNRSSMQWEKVNKENPTLKFYNDIIKLRKQNDALRYGDFQLMKSDKLFAFIRSTDDPDEMIVVIANPTDRDIVEIVAFPKIRSHDSLLSEKKIKVSVPAHTYTIINAKRQI